ncbi:MAG: hypothetical protein EP332_06430 [Bacteroidetes bacterium]|nr:MAG: hypothetical protein EP332_06430 [Bacteroidota bacterium]
MAIATVLKTRHHVPQLISPPATLVDNKNDVFVLLDYQYKSPEDWQAGRPENVLLYNIKTGKKFLLDIKNFNERLKAKLLGEAIYQ